MTTTNVKVEATIPRPSNEIYHAITDPGKISNYFVSYAAQQMEEGKSIRWEFDDAGVQFNIFVKKLAPDNLIVFNWGPTGQETQVEIMIESVSENISKVLIRESEWRMDQEGVSRALQQTEGWTDFLCCLKAYLLFNVNLRKGIVI